MDRPEADYAEVLVIDFEADVRLAKAGFAVWLGPTARSTWLVRESPAALARQMWRYGFHKALTLLLHPASLNLRQLAPPALLVCVGIVSAVKPRFGAGLFAAYVAGTAVIGGIAARRDGASTARGAVVPMIVHLSWGAGLIAGLARFLTQGTFPEPIHGPSADRR